jgi:hypothetical protein
MSSEEVLIGEKFGELTLLSVEGYHTEPSGHRRRLVKVQCSCGVIYETVLFYLKRNRGTKKCRKCSDDLKRIINIGDRYDKLIVCNYSADLKRPMVICKCDCGTENILIRAEVLKNNLTNNCGCAPRGRWQGVGKLSNTFLGRIKRNAKLRNIEFNLTAEELWKLFIDQNEKCAITDLPIEFSLKTFDKSTASLDRIDSKKGYTLNNVQWVHKDVNIMKMDFDMNYFIDICKMVVKKNG